jgi:hypothetical protein
MVTCSSIKTIMVNNKKVFAKKRYEPNDEVWWVDNIKVTGLVMYVQGYYCYVRDEYNNEYVKPHIELFLEESNVIQDLMNEITLMKKDIHNLNIALQRLQKATIPNYENTAFTIHPMLSRL